MSETPEKLYYSISEVSEASGVKAHVLRYWESQFSMLRPRKSRGGVRMYRPKELAMIEEIKGLLYDRGFTIAGARRQLLEERRERRLAAEEDAPAVRERGSAPEPQGGEEAAAVGAVLADIRAEIVSLRDRLSRPLSGHESGLIDRQ